MAGDDTLTGGRGADTFVFAVGAGTDTITDFGAGDRIRFEGMDGGFAALVIEQDGADAVIRYGDGDTIRLSGVAAEALGEDDFIFHPIVSYVRGDDTLDGGDGDDTLWGSRGDDTLNGGDGNDALIGFDGDDTLNGGDGNDTLIGRDGDDTLNGGDGNDTLIGEVGDDTLNGGAGDDWLYGGSGHVVDDDTLQGGKGDDRLFGGGGADRFVFDSESDTDTILDFRDGQDIIVIEGGLEFSDLDIEQSGDDTVIGGPADTFSIVVEGIRASQLTEADFDFTG